LTGGTIGFSEGGLQLFTLPCNAGDNSIFAFELIEPAP
jgi:hypothetical protein